MVLDIYALGDYREVIKEAMKLKSRKGRGQRAALSTFLRCQPTYISHVLSGRAEFSLEQVEAACRYFGFTITQQHYLILLVNWQRAGTKELKQYFRSLLDRSLQESREIKNVVGNKSHLSDKQRAEYYRTWRHAAIHMLLTIPDYNNVAKIAQQLRISESKVQETIEILHSSGLIQIVDNEIKVLHETLHLDRTDPEIQTFHTQHRLKALEALSEVKETDLHFSTFFSCAAEDLPKLKDALLKTIESLAAILKKSSPDTIGGLNIDFYEI